MEILLPDREPLEAAETRVTGVCKWLLARGFDTSGSAERILGSQGRARRSDAHIHTIDVM
jgi:hypothetical protein